MLERLLDRAGKARLRGDEAPASLSMASGRGAREYLALRSLDEFESFHAAIRLAERSAAITALRDRHRGDGEKLLRITVADLDALAAHLGAKTLARHVDDAAVELETWVSRFPVIGEVLATWRGGGKVRKHGPGAAGDLADAACAVAERLPGTGEERVLRKASARIFNRRHRGKRDNSKRLESPTPWLDVLVSGELDPRGMEKEHIWAALGLRKEPLPLLLAGNGLVELVEARAGHCRPRISACRGLRAIETQARSMLGIGNLASFHEPHACAAMRPSCCATPAACRRRPGAPPVDACSPACRPAPRSGIGAMSTKAVSASPPSSPKPRARRASRCIRGRWRPMRCRRRFANTRVRRHPRPSPRCVAGPSTPEIAESLRRTPVQLEQESLDPRLPSD